MTDGTGGPDRIIMRRGPPVAHGSEEALDTGPSWRAAVSAWASERLRAVRADWSSVNRWVLTRRLVLPALVVWGMAAEIAERPLRGAAGLVVIVALLARFTWPSAALLLAVASVDTVAAGVIAVPVIAYGAGRRIASLRRAGAIFALASATLTLKVLASVVPGSSDAEPWGLALLLATAFAGVGLILPGTIGALTGERARRSEALRERNAILERAQTLGDEQARMQERARIAGEMHDLLGHRLSLISLHAGALELRTRQTAPELSQQASVMRTTAKTALDELREVLGILKVDSHHEGTDGHGDDAGTRTDLSALVFASQRAGADVRLTWTGDDTTGLDGTIRRALHRVVREALTNVHKHAAGAATHVVVERGAEQIRVEVRNGLGTPGTRTTPGTSMGLVGLQERVRLAGGTIHAGADSERTEFVVSVLLPLVPAATVPGHSDRADTTIDQTDLAGRQTARSASIAETGSLNGSPDTGSTKTMSKPTKTTLFVLLGVVAVCCGGGVIGLKVFERKVAEGSISPETYTRVQVGQPEDQVRKAVGEKGSIARESLTGDEPPIPTGATCLYAYSSELARDGSRSVYRFCMAGGKLVQKQEIQ
jgi:signal transduction histidine kinase